MMTQYMHTCLVCRLFIVCLFASRGSGDSTILLDEYFNAKNAPPDTKALPKSTPPAKVYHFESVVVFI